MTEKKSEDLRQMPAAVPSENIPPELLRQMKLAQQPVQKSVEIPHPAQVGPQEYLRARWDYVKNIVPMSVAEVLGINDPEIQRSLSLTFENQYWAMRCSALEATVQVVARRMEIFRTALETVVPNEEARNNLIEQASTVVPDSFDKVPE